MPHICLNFKQMCGICVRVSTGTVFILNAQKKLHQAFFTLAGTYFSTKEFFFSCKIIKCSGRNYDLVSFLLQTGMSTNVKSIQYIAGDLQGARRLLSAHKHEEIHSQPSSGSVFGKNEGGQSNMAMWMRGNLRQCGVSSKRRGHT